MALTRLVILCHRNLSVLCLLITLSRHKNFLEADAAVEVWEAFSTESSARRFAHTAGEGLGVEIDVVERSPNRFVPTVMCRQGADCTSILNAINAMFSFEQTDA